MGLLKSFLTFIFFIFSSIYSLGIILGFVLLYSDFNQHPELITKAFEKSTGQQLILSGPLSLTFYPRPKIMLQNAIIKIKLKSNKKLEIQLSNIKFNFTFNTIFSENKKIKNIVGENVNIKIGGQTYLFENISGDFYQTDNLLEIKNLKAHAKNAAITGDFKWIDLPNDLKIIGKKVNIQITGQTYAFENISGDFNQSNDSLEIKNLKTSFNNIDINGHLKFVGSLKNLKIIGKLRSPEVKLTSSSTLSSLINVENLVGQWDFLIDHLVINQFEFHQAIIHAEILNQKIKFLSTAKFVQGETIFNGDYANKILKGQVEIKNANAGLFLGLINSKPRFLNGILHLTFSGSSQGDTFAALLSSLVGTLLIEIRQMTILNAAIDSRYIDIIPALWQKFNPAKNETELECVAMRFNINNGMLEAKNSIAVETPEIYVLGGGKMNIHSHRVNFMFNLYPRERINLKIGSFENLIYLKGTIEHPEITGSIQPIIQKGGTILLGIATGGISVLVEKLYGIVSHKGEPCRQILLEDVKN